MSETGIQWIPATDNACVGCSPLSIACQGCYGVYEAKRTIWRLQAIAKSEEALKTLEAYKKALRWENGEPVGWSGTVQFVPHALKKIVSQKKPTVFFMGSMTDMFHDTVQTEWLDQIFEAMLKAPQHRYTFLTKRPRNMVDKLSDTKAGRILSYSAEEKSDRMPEIYMGITAENQECFDERKPWLAKVPAAGRFVCTEPLLGPINLDRPGSLDGIDQVLTGGESGSNYRPLDWDWVREIRDACEKNSVPFFLQQGSGTFPTKLPYLDGYQHYRVIWER